MKESFDPLAHRKNYEGLKDAHTASVVEIGKLTEKRDALAQQIQEEYGSAEDAARTDAERLGELKKNENVEGVGAKIEEITGEDSGEELSIQEAERLFGKDFFGSKQIEQVFGQDIEATVLPFSKKELERAKELGQQLIFQTDRMDVKNPDTGEIERNVPITLENLKKYFRETYDKVRLFWVFEGRYKDEDSFKKEVPRAGARLTAKDLIPNSTAKSYIEQTDMLIEHLQEDVFKGRELPKQYEDAITEFKKKRPEIEPLAKSSFETEWRQGSQMLADLAITKLTRELPVEVMYRFILNDQINKDELPPSTYTWIAGRAAGSILVDVGLGGRNPQVLRFYPGTRWRGPLGIAFSRS